MMWAFGPLLYLGSATAGWAADKSYCLQVNYSAVPTLVNNRKITLNVNVGACASVSVNADGASIPAAYNSGTGMATFTTTGVTLLVTAVNWTSGGTGAAAKATLYNNLKWAFSLTLDDGIQSQYVNAKPLLDAKGWKAGAAVVGNWTNTGGANNYMSWATVQALRAAGWDIYNHSFTHPNPVNCGNFTTEFDQNQTAFTTRLPGYHVNHIVYPYEVSTSSGCAGFPPSYLISGEVAGGLNFVDVPLPNVYLAGRSGLYGTDPTSLQTMASNASANARPAWMIVITHSVSAGGGAPTDAYATNANTLGTLLNYLDTNFGSGGSRNMWFAPSGEVMDYLFTRDKAVVSTCVVMGTPTPTATFTHTRTNTPSFTATSTNTATHSATFTPTRTNTATFTATFTPTRTNTATFTSTFTPMVPTNTSTPTRTNTPTPTLSPTPIVPTNTPTPTSSFTPTRTNTSTSTSTFTNTRTNTPTFTLTSTPFPPTFTSTFTNTRTNTVTNTPMIPTLTPTSTSTSTNTRTSTPSFTATFTNTRTNTPSFTSTNTSTRTNTPTNTATPTNTYTGTAPPTNTPSATASPTQTNTSTSTGTSTSTSTPTSTSTSTSTFTNTRTNTPSFTLTNTSSRTPTPSATNTPTNTSTPTNTYTGTTPPTNTPSATASPTRTDSTTPTPSATLTATPSATPTFTSTRTNTPSFTSTASTTPTPSATPTFTSTRTSTSTFTSTSTSTATPTSTASTTSTFTHTRTYTPTHSSTNTPTSTATASATPSSTSTSTRTPTSTSTNTASATASPTSTSSRTSTSTPSSTPSGTPTAVTGGGGVVPYPNPVVGPGPVTLQITLSAPAEDVRVLIFTTGFRKVSEIHLGPLPAGVTPMVYDLRDRWGAALANGMYYVILRGVQGRVIGKLLVHR